MAMTILLHDMGNKWIAFHVTEVGGIDHSVVGNPVVVHARPRSRCFGVNFLSASVMRSP
jgi:hypothetical protein